MNANEIRKKFIEDNAEFLLDELATVLRGEGEFSCEYGSHLSYSLELLEKMILKAQDTKMVSVESVRDVLQALAKGKIDAKEARNLIELLKVESEIDSLSSDDKSAPPAVHFYLYNEEKDETQD